MAIPVGIYLLLIFALHVVLLHSPDAPHIVLAALSLAVPGGAVALAAAGVDMAVCLLVVMAAPVAAVPDSGSSGTGTPGNTSNGPSAAAERTWYPETLQNTRTGSQRDDDSASHSKLNRCPTATALLGFTGHAAGNHMVHFGHTSNKLVRQNHGGARREVR